MCFDKENKTTIGISSDEFTQNLIENMNDKNENMKTIDNLVLKKLKETYEGLCINDGYVLKDTIRIRKRTNFEFPINSLRLHYTTNVIWNAKVCCPRVESKIRCRVLSKNKIGMLADLEDEKSPIVILLPNDLAKSQNEREKVSEVKEGDHVFVEILGKKFELHDTKIMVIARII
jgi:hypothetical protein